MKYKDWTVDFFLITARDSEMMNMYSKHINMTMSKKVIVRALFFPVGFFMKVNDYYILFLKCILKTKMVVGSPGIMADTNYAVINMSPIKDSDQSQVIIIVSMRVSVVRFLASKKGLILFNDIEIHYRRHHFGY